MRSTRSGLCQFLSRHTHVDIEIFHVQLAGEQLGEQQVAGGARFLVLSLQDISLLKDSFCDRSKPAHYL